MFVDRRPRSGAAPAIRHRHADYYLRIAQAARSGLRGPDQLAWAGDLAVDIDNFQAAVDWAVQESSTVHLLGIIEPLAVYSTASGAKNDASAHRFSELGPAGARTTPRRQENPRLARAGLANPGFYAGYAQGQPATWPVLLANI